MPDCRSSATVAAGLLTTLEAEDLIALLDFLTSPYADLRLAHALRSPVFGCSDDDLMRLAAAPAQAGGNACRDWRPTHRPRCCARAQLLHWWLDLAGVLPVHDLLDRIYHEGDVRRRYAAVAPAALHAQIQANLDAFIELALAIDAGRYPSLPRFVDELASLKRHGSDEAPDEGLAAAGDALRVMTIHGAKGLEAEIVVLADAHARAAPEGESVLVVWPPETPAPYHFSLVARGEATAPDPARAAWFARGRRRSAAQEDWNLLYVAATRARQVLIVSGTAPARGTLDDTWYARLQAAEALSVGAAPAQRIEAASHDRWVLRFPARAAAHRPAHRRRLDSEAMRLGRAWHALLEHRRAGVDRRRGSRPCADAGAGRERRGGRAACPARMAAVLRRTAEAELELVADNGDVLRVDRLVEHEDALWIIDFKWRVTADERPPYEAQVRRYAARACRRYAATSLCASD